MARYRPVFTGLWVCDDKFQDYSPEGKLLFLFLITNDHLGEAGIYKITYKTMSNATDIPKDKVKELVNNELKNNVSYDEKKSVIFVHKFLKFNGGGNPQLLQRSIEKDRRLIKTFLWREFKKYYTTDLKPIENSSESDSANTNPNSIPNTNTNTKEEEEILLLLKKVKNYPCDSEETVVYIRGLKEEFPDLNFLEEIKRKCAWWIDNPLTKKSNVHLQIRNWFQLAQKWAEERKRQLKVGESSYESVIPDKDWEKVARHLFNTRKKESEVSRFYAKSIKIFPKIKKQWEKSDKKPETFIDLIEDF